MCAPSNGALLAQPSCASCPAAHLRRRLGEERVYRLLPLHEERSIVSRPERRWLVRLRRWRHRLAGLVERLDRPISLSHRRLSLRWSRLLLRRRGRYLRDWNRLAHWRSLRRWRLVLNGHLHWFASF